MILIIKGKVVIRLAILDLVAYLLIAGKPEYALVAVFRFGK